MRVHVRRDFVYHFQEIFDRHVRMGGRDMAVATAMEAGGVTTERALPKELRNSCILARFFRMLLNNSNARRLRNPGRLFILCLFF